MRCHSKAKQGSGCLFKFWLFLQKQASNTQLGLGFVFQAGRQTLEDQHEDQQLSVEEHEEWGPPEWDRKDNDNDENEDNNSEDNAKTRLHFSTEGFQQ